VSISEIPEILKGAFITIGSGLTTIQSSSLGIPTLVCLDSNPHFTSPGFFNSVNKSDYNELESYEVNELSSITNYINKLCDKTELEYIEFCNHHIERTKLLSIERNYGDFTKLFEKKALGGNLNLFKYAWSFLVNRNSKVYLNRFKIK